jgi:hypothetical protein
MKSLGRKLRGTKSLLYLGGGFIFVGGSKSARYGSCDETLLGVVPSSTRSDAMSDVVIKLTGNRLHSLISGRGFKSIIFVASKGSIGIVRIVFMFVFIAFRCVFIVLRCVFIVIGQVLYSMILPDGSVDLGEGGIEAMRDARCFDVTGSLQKGEGIGIDTYKGII